jgi:hypothetical protein
LEWHRTERNMPLTLTFPDGSLYQLKPGNTWFELIGETSKMETSEDGKSYRFEWSIP